MLYLLSIAPLSLSLGITPWLSVWLSMAIALGLLWLAVGCVLEVLVGRYVLGFERNFWMADQRFLQDRLEMLFWWSGAIALLFLLCFTPPAL